MATEFELLHRIRQRCIEQRVEHEGLVGREQERIAIGHALCGSDSAHQCVTAGAIFDHYSLVPFFLKLPSDDTEQYVRRTPGCERDDHADGVGGIVEGHGIALPKDRAEQARERGDDDVHD